MKALATTQSNSPCPWCPVPIRATGVLLATLLAFGMSAATASADNPSPPGGVSNGLALWLDASAATTMTLIDTTVSEWRDKWGGTTKMTLRGGTPTLVAAGIGGYPTVHFNTSSWMNDSVNHPAPVTILYVARQTGVANARVLSATGNNWVMGYWNGGCNEFYFAGNGWVYGPYAKPSDTNPHLHAATIGTSSTTVYEAGNPLVTKSDNNDQGPNSLELNAQAGDSEFSDCDISEVVVYHRILSGDELNAVGWYLQHKYGLSGAYTSPGLVITVTSPANGQTLSTHSPVTATATVENGTGPYTVKFFSNTSGTMQQAGANMTAPPYELNLGTLAPGSYEIYATVDDSASATNESAHHTFTVADLPPSVAITSPSNNAGFAPGTAIGIAATASDDSAVANVDFYADGNLIGSATTPPYTCTWNGAGVGAHTLTAVAWDDAGQHTTSAVVNVTVATWLVAWNDVSGVYTNWGFTTTDDLILNGAPSLYSTEFTGYSPGIYQNNGNVENSGYGSPGQESNGNIAQFNLSLANSSGGYDVSHIDIYTQHGDAGWVMAGATITYQDLGGEWHPFNSFGRSQYAQPGNGNPTQGKFTILPTSPVTGAQALKIAWNDQGNGGANVVEIAAYGTASNPTLSTWLTSPTDGATFLTTASVTAMATVASGTAPYTVTFVTDIPGKESVAGTLVSGTTYSANLGTLGAGSYHIHAEVTDSADPHATVSSATRMITVVIPGTVVIYVGTDTATDDGWRTPSVAKPNDIDGDNIYGTDGYTFYQYGHSGWFASYNATYTLQALPSYISSVSSPTSGWGGGSGHNFGVMDDPLSPTSNHNATWGYYPGANSTAQQTFTISRSTSDAFRLTLWASSATGAEGQTQDFSVSDGSSTVSHTLTFTAAMKVYYMSFDIPAGTNPITVTCLNNTVDGHPGLGGFAFDSLSANAYSIWANQYAGGPTAPADGDFNNDGVQNGIAFFMGTDDRRATLPGAVDGKVIWPNCGNIPASEYGAGNKFVVQTSLDLVSWDNVPVEQLTTNTSGPDGALTYTLPTGVAGGKIFARLVVSP